MAGPPCLSTGNFSGPVPPMLKTETSINNYSLSLCCVLDIMLGT